MFLVCEPINKVLIGSNCSSSFSKVRLSSNSWFNKLRNKSSGNMTMSLLSCSLLFRSFRDFIGFRSFWVNSLLNFPNPGKDLTSFVIIGVGHSVMPLSFIGSICGWFLELSSPSCSVLATQGVHPSCSAKRSLSLDHCCTHCVYSVFRSLVSESL